MFVSGKKALRHQLLLEGYTEEELESLWNFTHSLFLEMDQFLQSPYKHVKLWEKLLTSSHSTPASPSSQTLFATYVRQCPGQYGRH